MHRLKTDSPYRSINKARRQRHFNGVAFAKGRHQQSKRRPGRYRHASLKTLREPSLQELSQFCCRPELRYRIQFLERRCECIRQTPDGSRAEFLVLWLEVQIMYCPSQVLGRLQFAFDESFVDYDFRGDIGEFTLLPSFDLLSHRLEVALHPIDSDRNAIDERKRLRVFGQYRGKIPAERYV